MLVYVIGSDGRAIVEECTRLHKAGFTPVILPISTDGSTEFLDAEIAIVSRCDAIHIANPTERIYFNPGLPITIAPQLPQKSSTELRCPRQAERFLQIVMHMYRTHLKKNSDYSPANISGPGEIGLVTRLWDKMARLMNLVGFNIDAKFVSFEPKEAKCESKRDSYLDLAVYGVNGLILDEGNWGR